MSTRQGVTGVTSHRQTKRAILYSHKSNWTSSFQMPSKVNPAPAIFSEEFKSKVENHTVRVGIIGLGYVGLPLALLFSEQKFAVTGFDIDPRKVSTLSEGGSYIQRILPAEIQAARAQGLPLRLGVTR